MEYQTATDPADLTELEKKHIPVIDIVGNEAIVRVGEITHPMQEDHYIEWIELYLGSHLLSRKNLKPGRKPEAAFDLGNEEGNIWAAAHCNQHGTWKCQTISLAEL